MSRSPAAAALLRLDLSGVQLPELGWSEAAFASRLVSLLSRRRLAIGGAKLAEEMLTEYQQLRKESVIGKILSAARRLQGRIDRLVIFGTLRTLAPARALFQAGCHPYHNELSRGERAGYPRIYFAGDRCENDAVQGLLELLGKGRTTDTLEDRWGMVILGETELSPAFATVLPLFVEQLGSSCRNNVEQLAERLIVVSTPNCPALPDAPGCPTFTLPQDLGSFAGVSPFGLVPAALMGLDVLRLSQGAHALQQHFEQAAPEDNVVLQWAAVREWLAEEHRTIGCEFEWWDSSLVGFERLFWSEHSPASLRVNVVVDRPRFDPLASLPEMCAGEVAANAQAARAQNRPTVELRLPSTQIGVLGQLFQFCALASQFSQSSSAGA